MRKTYSSLQKAQVALEALKGQRTMSQLSSQFQVHPNQINHWKTIVQEGLPGLFDRKEKQDKAISSKDSLISELYKIIGQRDTELEWIKKKLFIPDP